MIRLASALALGACLACAALPTAAQQASPSATGAGASGTTGQTCKKIYVQKKSQRTGTYVHVPRQRCT